MTAAKFKPLTFSVSGAAVTTRPHVCKDEGLTACAPQGEHLHTPVHSGDTLLAVCSKPAKEPNTSTLLPICLSNSHLPCPVSLAISLSHFRHSPLRLHSAKHAYIHSKAAPSPHSALHSILLLICLPLFLTASVGGRGEGR
jgi:hypothetical protein